MKNEFTEIKAMLDKAVISNDPIKRFEELLPKVKSYSSVDSAWITNSAIFVKIKGGSVLSWIANPEQIKPNIP
jgi:hypothetical protein